MTVRARVVAAWVAPPSLVLSALMTLAVPTELQQPGTQPNEVSSLNAVDQCDNCHGGYNPAVEPALNWRGSMMAHASRDPVFWATMAVAEQDFPGVGDFCLRCHTPRAWLEGRSTPSSGEALTSADVDGVECAICHKLVNPDDSENVGVQNAPFLAHDEGTPKTGYYGSGMMVLWGGNERMGPYGNTTARHGTLKSLFHRDEDLCGTCHDVSNPVVGDLAHDNGAQVPLQPGTFSGVPGSPVETKAAFNNFPFAYGIVERTFSEHKASLWPSTLVSGFLQLPPELQDGAVRAAYDSALLAGRGGNYQDNTARSFTCQSCHMPPVVGAGANKHNVPVRRDLPLHDLTGGNYWAPEAIQWLDARGRLRAGGGLTSLQRSALAAGAQRARRQLDLAASLSVSRDTVRVVNLTGHKLISGYPEGRRMWLDIRWRDAQGALLREDGAYGLITATIDGAPVQVETILDLGGTNTVIYEAQPGMTQEWANQLLALGYPAAMPLEYDRASGAVQLTLGQLAAQPPGSAHDTFHFALNNTVVSDNRIPPYGMSYDEARQRNALPVPASQYGAPQAGGVYRHWDEVALDPPPGATFATVDLLYQPTSWEYVQFLYLDNDGQHPFLGGLGRDLLDAWFATGMAKPHVMASTTWCYLPGTGEDFEMSSQVNGAGDPGSCSKAAAGGDTIDVAFRSPGGAFAGTLAALALQIYPTGQPPVPVPFLPSFHLSQIQASIVVAALPQAGVSLSFAVPSGGEGATIRMQALAFSAASANAFYAASDAHDVTLR